MGNKKRKKRKIVEDNPEFKVNNEEEIDTHIEKNMKCRENLKPYSIFSGNHSNGGLTLQNVCKQLNLESSMREKSNLPAKLSLGTASSNNSIVKY